MKRRCGHRNERNHSPAGPVLLFALLTVAFAPAEAAPTVARYACPASHDLSVTRFDGRARVSFGGHVYDLRRKPSSIGVKYISSSAALIIDGQSAVFVANDQVDLGRTCVSTMPVASAR